MSSNFSIDINCDLGEGFGNESLIMPFISSCNIACGGHAGNQTIIDEVITLAKKYQVKIGAHPSFPDKDNFGRKLMEISDFDLQKSLENQILLMVERANLQQVNVHHVKPHGALYNLVVNDSISAQIVVNAIINTIPSAFLYVPYASEIEKVALKNGLNIKYEAFADRNYNPDLTLISRTEKNALITNKDEVLKHIEEIILNQRVNTSDGFKCLKTDTICVHGDTINAEKLVKYIHQKLTKKDIQIV